MCPQLHQVKYRKRKTTRLRSLGYGASENADVVEKELADLKKELEASQKTI